MDEVRMMTSICRATLRCSALTNLQEVDCTVPMAGYQEVKSLSFRERRWTLAPVFISASSGESVGDG
jgi:hypothetical protein